jgi:hypothetical protein
MPTGLILFRFISFSLQRRVASKNAVILIFTATKTSEFIIKFAEIFLIIRKILNFGDDTRGQMCVNFVQIRHKKMSDEYDHMIYCSRFTLIK